MEEDFPRGGSGRKASEPKTAKAQETVDNLFQAPEPVVKKKRKNSNKQEEENGGKKQKTGAGGLKLNTATNVEILHLKNLKVGTMMLGCVKAISDFEFVLGLPDGLTGYLPMSNISDTYTKILNEKLASGNDLEEVASASSLLSLGLLVRCVVSSLHGTKEGFVSLKVSINPKEVNKELSAGSLKSGMTLGGCVESVEDHGFLIDIGVNGTKAFLPKEASGDEAKSGPKRDLKVGQYVTVLVKEVKNSGRVARLTVNHSAVNQACAEAQHGWTLSSLVPGLLVQACVKKVTAHGLIVTFLSSFTGVVDFMHIDSEKASTYRVGDEVRARVLYVEPSSRLVGLTLRSQLLSPGGGVLNKVTGEHVGAVLQGCKMKAVHHHSGAVMDLPDGSVAFVHRNQMKEADEEFNPNRLLAQPEHTVRITDYSPLEQIHLATMRKRTIETKFFSYQDVKLGQVVEGTIQSLEKFGMHVKISDHVKGLVPRLHLADIVLANPEKKFKEGAKVKCRVLSVDPLNRKLVLSRKKALVESTLPPFLSYADASPGVVSHGFIVCVKDFGCIVRFYGDVKGLVPVKELATEGTVNPQSFFYEGQVVKAKVLKCDPVNEKLLLSFKAVTTDDIEQPKRAPFDFQVGKKVEVIVRRKELTGFQVSILPEETPAFLPIAHLSDHVSNCSLLWTGLQEEDTISNLVCLSRDKQTIIVSKKPLLKARLEAGDAVSSFSELEVGTVMLGWVKNIMDYGVFISFPHGLFGLAPKSAMSDKFVTDTQGLFQIGQTVLAKVTNLDEEKKRFLVSLKVSEVSASEEEARTRLIHGLQERTIVTDMMSCRDDDEVLQQLSSVSLGDKLKMIIGETREDGSLVLTSDQLSQVTVLASKYHTTGVNTTSGGQVNAVVLYVDLLTRQVHVSLLPALNMKKKTLEKDSQHVAVVQHADRDVAVISLGNTGRLTVTSTSSHLNETFRFKSERLSEGSKLSVSVIEPACEDLGGLPLISWQFVSAKQVPSTSGSKGPKHCYAVGDLVTATIRTVKPLHVLVSLPNGVTGSIHVSQVQESPTTGRFPTSTLRAGAEVKARVIGAREVRGHKFLPISHPNFMFCLPELTLHPSKLKEDVDIRSLTKGLRSYKPGDEISCFVSKYDPQKQWLEVAVSPTVSGGVELLNMINNRQEVKRLKKLFKVGQCLSAKVVKVCSKNSHQLILSLTGTLKLEQGTVTMGMVEKVIPQFGLKLKLPFSRYGKVCVTDLSDTYTADPLAQYKEGQLVRCCIIGQEEAQFVVSLRPSRIHSEKGLPVKDVEICSVSDLKEGQVLQGYVQNTGKMGIFVRLSRSVIGRALLQNATNYFLKDPNSITEHISQNALLTVKVLNVDPATGHVGLSLLPEDSGKPDVIPQSQELQLRLKGEEKEEFDKMIAMRKRKVSESKQDESEAKKYKKDPAEKKKKTKKKEPKPSQGEDPDSGVDVYFREEETTKKKTKAKSVSAAAEKPDRLQVAAAFSWDSALSSLKPATATEETYDSSNEDQEEESKPAKKSRREAALERQEAERQLSRSEAERLDPSARPEDSEAFERLLLSSPDSSLLWLQYMAFHLQATQIEQARAVAERALKTISFREEQEKLNVWVALLNLENMYGTEESLQKAFERAVQYCEPMPVYQQLADIYAKSDKIKEAESLYKNMLKRFRQEKAVWQNYGLFLLRQGQSDAANALLQRALQSLSNKEHVDLIVRFARMEFQHGNAERAKAMFEKVLASYPKRTDLWSVFIDVMMKHGSQKDIRELFDRVIHLSASVKKIKFFFKRFLEYEKKHGTAESVQAVKQKALEYVESKGADNSS